MRERHLVVLVYVLVVYVLATLFTIPANADWVSLGAPPSNVPEVKVLEDSKSGTIIEFKIGGYFIDKVDIKGDTYSIISLPKSAIFLNKGLPELPRMNKSVIIPDDAHMSYEIVETEYETKRIPPVVPSKGNLYRTIDPSTVPHTFNEFYQLDSWFPEETLQLHDPFIVRDFRGLTIQFNLFQYNPVQKTLRICKRLVVRIYPDGLGKVNVKTRKRDRISKAFLGIYRNLFLNFSEKRYDLIPETGNMLIITISQYYNNMLPLVGWKVNKGIPTKLVRYPEDTGTGADNVKAYIQNEYDTDGVTFILLVGDAEHIPPAEGITDSAAGQPADLVYCYLEGGIDYPDAFISRFSAETQAQIDNQVIRSINYERYPQLGADWYHKGTGIASSEGTPKDWERCDLLRDDLLGYIYTAVDRLYEDDLTTTNIANSLNDGRSIVNYIGHGTPTKWFCFNPPRPTIFTNDDVFNLNNVNMLPFIISVACKVGDFPGKTCFSEAWLRAGSPDAPTGAIAFYGSSILQSWVPPTVAQAEAVDLLVQDDMVSIGCIMFNGYCCMIEKYGDGGREMFETWHIFGDCSVQTMNDTAQLCATIYDGNGGPLTAEAPYRVFCDVEVPSGETLTIQAGAEIYFESGCKIIANGTLNANGEIGYPIKLLSESAPHRGMKLLTDLRLQNGEEFKPGG